LYPQFLIKLNTIVESIDYSQDKVVVNTQNGQYSADKVIVAVPLKILQNGDVSFIPNLPQDKQNTINTAKIWEGFKAFFEFSNKFYKDEHVFNIVPASDVEKIYYNASFG
jgi:monoamine oxidase